jgi:hypothetical protein
MDECSIQMIEETLMCLHYQLLDGSSEEMLSIGINSFSGELLCKVPTLGKSCDALNEFEKAINKTGQPVKECLRKIRVNLMKRRFEEAVDNGRFRKFMPPHSPIQENVNGEQILLQFVQETDFYLVRIGVWSLIRGF